jgi:hypothetical protein
VDLLLNDLRARLAERRITLVVTEAALRFIAEQGFDPAYGADRCGVSLPARLRPGSGEHCYAVIFPTAARSLLILGWGTHRGISERSTGRDGSGMSAGVGDSTPVVVCSNCQTKNRVPAVAHGVPRCGKCHTPLRWVVNGSDASFADIVEASTIPVLVDMWAPGAVPAGW